MVSWVKNRVTLHGADQKEIDEVIDFLRSEKSEFDFNNIIPIPNEIKETMEEGCHDWYEWSRKNWGTKYNACDARREGNVIVFETPSYGVAHLILMVSEKFKEVVFDYEFAATNFGHNTARYTFKAGEIIVEYEPADASIEARLLAKSILGWEPKELFYY